MEEKDTKKTKTEEVKPRPTKLEEIDTWKMRALVEKAGRISSTMNSLELQFNAMKKEQDEFMQSLSRQMSGGTSDTKYWDGISEDAVFNPPDPNQGLADMNPEVSDNPGPGEVGFGPDTRIQG